MIVYLVTNLIDFRIYVGKTKQTLLERWNLHLADVKLGSSFYLHNAIRKHGASSFQLTVLFQTSSEEEMNRSESLWIITLHSYDPEVGYNMTFGGEGGSPTEVVRQKLSEKRSGMTFPKQWRESMASSQRKFRKPWLRKPRSPEVRKKISEGNKRAHKENPNWLKISRN